MRSVDSESTMADLKKPPDPPPGGGNRCLSKSNSIPDQRAANVWTNACVPGGRTFEKIIEEEKRDRSIIELHVIKNMIEDGENGTVKASKLSEL